MTASQTRASSHDRLRSVAMLMHQCTTLLKRRFELVTKADNITLTQWRVLALLDRDGAMRQAGLGEALNASPMTVSDVLERLEKADMVRRDAAADDSRAKEVTITRAGREKVGAVHLLGADVFADAFDGLSADDIEHLRRTLARIAENLTGAGQ